MGASDSTSPASVAPIKPFVPADQSLPEFTLRAVLLGVLLASGLLLWYMITTPLRDLDGAE